MNNASSLGANLRILKAVKHLSLAEFSAEMHIARATLQSIMKDGHTTLDTACQIANAMNMPLSTLLDGELSLERVTMLHGFLLGFGWYSELPCEKQWAIAQSIHDILDILQG